MAATVALGDPAHLHTTVTATIRDRAKLTAALETVGLQVAPSQANFVLVDVGQPGRTVYEALLEQGVIVRPMPTPLDTWLRVTVGRPHENQRFLDSLGRVLRQSRA